MRIPRDLSGSDLVKILAQYGYVPTRQTGSHIRLTTRKKGEHHVTIPNHSPLKTGTLSSILSEVSIHFGIKKDELMRKLFG